MSDLAEIALLPAGLNDALAPEAAFEAQAVARLMRSFAARGYQRVRPPLMEFEESLFAGNGQAMAKHAFRLMDPVSRRMMALRPDMTLQVARIATTRLKKAPRPLRLSYAGPVLRVKGSQSNPERQFDQAGVELIGASAPEGDIEVILMAVESLIELGVAGLSVDLGMPPLVGALLAGLEGDALANARAALDRKDAAALAGQADVLGERLAAVLSALLAASGAADKALAVLEDLDLPPAAATEREALVEVARRVRREAPDLNLTVDAVENRGFEYHAGVSFTLFARGVTGELGRGGRYRAGVGVGRAEAATGVTLFMDPVLQSLPAPSDRHAIFLPAGTPGADGRRLRDEGWTTVAGLDAGRDAAAEARLMNCSHLWKDGKVTEL
ncbi:MAG: ATP phosphoribosyltransferase regulatory subunit [Magnetospirillum sp. WYHS-4]